MAVEMPTRGGDDVGPCISSNIADARSTMCGVDLTPDQLRIVQAVYDVFRQDGRWPIVDAIDRLADERWELDAFAVLRSLPVALALVDRRHLREDNEVKLRVRAIAGCDHSAADLALFARFARWLAEKERSFRPASMHTAEQVRVTSEQLAVDLAGEGVRLDSLACAKLASLAGIERLSWGGSYEIEGDPGRWEILLRRDIRPFRRVETLSDYLGVRDRLDAVAEEDARQVPGLVDVLALDQPHQPSTPVDDRRYAFIAMPFGATWSAAVHGCIHEVCQRVHASGVALRWERADQIERPGRITEQILDALSAADVVIADITDLNANVIYELGYADANRTPLILLSQDPSASPFDLKDLRQIAYSPEDLDATRAPLERHLRAALTGERDNPDELRGGSLDRGGPNGDELDELLELAEKAPVAAILGAHSVVEDAVKSVALAAGITDAQSLGLDKLSLALAERGVINPRTGEALGGLIILRTLAVHGPKPLGSRAREYIVIAEAVLYALSQSTRSLDVRPTIKE